MALYPSVKTLRLKLSKFNELVFPPSGPMIMNQLESLWMDGELKNDIDINGFVNENRLNLHRLSKLRLFNFGMLGFNRNRWFDANKFSIMLSQFQNLDHLTLARVVLNGNLDAEKLKAVHPNLNYLELLLRPTPSVGSLVQVFANQLENLSVSGLDVIRGIDQGDVSKLDFGQLRSLDMLAPSAKCWNGILKTAVGLKSISIHPAGCRRDRSISPSGAETMMIKTITTCRSLECIQYDDEEKMIDAVLRGIAKGLYETKDRERREIKISIVMTEKCEDMKGLAFNIVNVLQWLQNSKTKHFMLIVRLEDNGNKMIELMNELRSITSHVTVKVCCHRIVLINKDCASKPCFIKVD